MNLSDQTTRALRNVLAELEKEQSDLQQVIASIQKLLPAKVPPVGSMPPSNGSFASMVREALVGIGRVAAPKEVAKALTASGYQYPGKSDFGSVVANELFRQAQSKKSPIVKVDRGQYEVQSAKETK